MRFQASGFRMHTWVVAYETSRPHLEPHAAPPQPDPTSPARPAFKRHTPQRIEHTPERLPEKSGGWVRGMEAVEFKSIREMLV